MTHSSFNQEYYTIFSATNTKAFALHLLTYIQNNIQYSKAAFCHISNNQIFLQFIDNCNNTDFFENKIIENELLVPKELMDTCILTRKKYEIINSEQNSLIIPFTTNDQVIALFYLQNFSFTNVSLSESLDFQLQSLSPFLNNLLRLEKAEKNIAENDIKIGIFEEKLTELTDELREKESQLHRFQIVVKETNNSIMIFNSQLDLEWVNNGFIKLLGFTMEEYIEKFGENLYQNSLFDNIEETVLLCIESQKSLSFETVIQNKAGENIWLRRTITPIINHREDLDRLVTIDTGISDLKRAEIEISEQQKKLQEQTNLVVAHHQEIEKAFKRNSVQSVKMQAILMKLNQQNIELENARAIADKANAEKSQFLANMSHEIRTPIHGVLGMTELLLKTELDKTQREYAELTKNAAESLLEIINDILDISKIEAGKIELDYYVFNIETLAQTIVKTLEYKALEKDLYLHYVSSQNMPVYINADATRIKQIIINLINNALKFTHKGGVTLNISVTEHEQKAQLNVSVTDTGIGIPEDKQHSIFEKFTQADSSTTRKYGGTGLGLSISSQLVEMMEGTLTIHSIINQGSTFSFSIPLPLPEKNEIEKLKLSENHINTTTEYKFSNNFNILVAEDNKINQKYIANLLDLYHIHTDIVENGLLAVEKITNKQYHCVLMDMHMPELNGIDATLKIRSFDDEYFKTIPIIALTAAAYKEDEEKMLNAGMNAYISKPINEAKLIEILKEIDNNKKTEFQSSEENNISTPEQNIPISNPETPKTMPDNIISRKEFDSNFGVFKKAVLVEIITDFIDAHENKLNKMRQHIDNKDARKLMLDAHSFKGEIALFGAESVKEKFLILENMGKENNFSDIENSFNLALEYTAYLIDALKKIIHE
ncbi:MAG: response regulator [Bacteroidales bacterium]|nr:response regulator [Bacteroidales bacterium]